MHIIWFIIGYFLIGIFAAYLYAKAGLPNSDGAKCVMMIWAWPFVILVGVIAIWPGELFDKLCRKSREERRIREDEKKQKKLKENCSKCAWDGNICGSDDKPWALYCYVKPREEIKDETQKTE